MSRRLLHVFGNIFALSEASFAAVFAVAVAVAASGFAAPLTLSQTSALKDARTKGSYAVEIVSVTASAKIHTVVLLGETHVKGWIASNTGKEVLKQFDLRGVEGVSSDDVKYMHAEQTISNVNHLRALYNFLSFFGGRDSTILDAAKDGYYFEPGAAGYDGKLVATYVTEEPGKPAVQKPQSSSFIFSAGSRISAAHAMIDGRSWYVQPKQGETEAALAALPQGPVTVNIEYGNLKDWEWVCAREKCEPLITQRNYRMAANILTELANFPDKDSMLVVVGSAHVAGLKRILENGANTLIVRR